MRGRLVLQYAMSAAVIVGAIALWEFGVKTGYLKAYQFPPASRIAEGFVEIATNGFPTGITIWSHILTTVTRILQGYLAAIVLAVPVGLVIGAFPLLNKMLEPLIVFCRSIATLSLLPLVIVWFGAGELTKVILIAYGCFWVMLSNVIAAVVYVDPVLIRAGRSFGLKGVALYREIVLPAALPRMFAGARMALGVGFMVIVGAEMIGTIEGLGALIMEARTFYRSEITIIGMLVIGVLGFVISTGLAALERMLLPWGSTSEGARA
ncbi:ABC transporter permease subunit [Nitratireductor sp. CAU 1489]|uniref:ABC transporter permease subunit n=1 Tax=Nitratireductor arenosus TaxID=2682096 RepID=A0A844QAZ1_9HYPH|nr:ABC transporter permease [Nitratireductor arenosus]MVA95814.1 ABC transporter permease subunit [Nitratireductor arenosus]